MCAATGAVFGAGGKCGGTPPANTPDRMRDGNAIKNAFHATSGVLGGTEGRRESGRGHRDGLGPAGGWSVPPGLGGVSGVVLNSGPISVDAMFVWRNRSIDGYYIEYRFHPAHLESGTPRR